MNDQRNYRYLIYSLFLLSGISGLIYQIVWTRLLVVVFGNTMLATSTVLSAFMGGLAAGSYTLGRYIDRKPRPLLQVYACLEAGIGLFALIFPFLIHAVTPLYASLYNGVAANIVLLNLVRFAVCFAIIALPTFLMGGTLPVLIKRFTGDEDSIGHQTGFLYGLNTVGAVVGTFACGYFLLRLLGMQKTTWVGVAINLSVAAAAWYLGKQSAEAPVAPPVKEPAEAHTYEAEGSYSRATIRMILIGIGISGFCGLAYEVFWTRMLNLFLHNNIYSFTAILGTFLIGIATGSLLYARYLTKSENPVRLFVWLQLGIGVVSYATPFLFRIFHSGLFNNFSETLTLAKTAVIMIGPTVMMGIAVPLAIQICRRGAQHEGTSVGSVYAVNTVGAILGAFMAGFVLLPGVGLHRGVIIVAALNILAGFLPWISTLRPALRPAWAVGFVLIVAAMALAAPSDLFRSLFQAANPTADIIHYKEGKVANVLVYDFKKLGYKDFHLNAVNEASSRLWHVQLFKLLGLLPTLVHPNPDDALMIAFGAGMSAGACATNVKSLDVVDLNPDIQGIAAAYTRENLDVIHQPNFHQVVNDGRNALLVSPRKYSLIISDATNPKMFDSWTLYSQEFYKLVKERLKPDGVFCQWVVIPLPGDAIKVILNTFRSVFPHMSFWAIYGSSQVLMLGTPERLEIDYADLQKRLEPLYDKAGLAEFGINTPEKFLSFFLLGEDGVAKMLKGFDKISTDDLPYAQFHIKQDVEGADQCMDLVRYQESIRSYMSPKSTPPPSFSKDMTAYEDIARRLNVGFLTNNDLKYEEAAVVADDAGFDDANVDHLLNHCPEKQRHFQQRLLTHPDDVTAHNWLGNIFLLSGKYEQARKEFNTTLKLKPDHAFARMNLAMTDLATGNLDSAVAGFMAVSKQSPTKQILRSVDVQLNKVRILRKLKYQPESAELMHELGIAYYSEGKILDAVKAYRKAAELSGNKPEVLYNLAQICENHELVSEAAELYQKLAAIKPDYQPVSEKNTQFALLSHDPSQLRKWENGRIEISEAVEESKREASEHPPTCDQALAMWNDADPDGSADPAKLRKAAELYERSARIKPSDLHAYIDAATIYEALNDLDHAAELWEQAAKVRTDMDFIPRQAARLRAMSGLAGQTRPSPERAVLLRNVAAYYRSVDEPERALDYLHESLRIVPGEAEAWADLAETATEAGLYREALDAAEKALSMQPTMRRAATVRDALVKVVNKPAV
ncbi:MAG TPA: fused MFS/spermidine synthase [bacterium]